LTATVTSPRVRVHVRMSICLAVTASLVVVDLSYRLTPIRAEGLPSMDANGGIDAFVEAIFSGTKPLRTKYVHAKGKQNLAASWQEELWIPVVVPTMTSHVELVRASIVLAPRRLADSACVCACACACLCANMSVRVHVCACAADHVGLRPACRQRPRGHDGVGAARHHGGPDAAHVAEHLRCA
jgi:hypothetical protein